MASHILLLLLVAGDLFRASICCAAHEAGWVIGWGENGAGQATGVLTAPGSSTGVVKVASGYLSSAVSISAGMSHSLGLLSDGTVVGWGQNVRTESTRSPGLPIGAGPVGIAGRRLDSVRAISAGWS